MACKHDKVGRGGECWSCLSGCGGEFIPDPRPESPARAQDAQRGPSEAKAEAKGWSGETRGADADTVALVRRRRAKIRELTTTVHGLVGDDCVSTCVATRCSAADAWLEQHSPAVCLHPRVLTHIGADESVCEDCHTHIPRERWEPCAGEHVETKDGRWMVRHWYGIDPITDKAMVGYAICEGEHRKEDHGTGWERRV